MAADTATSTVDHKRKVFNSLWGPLILYTLLGAMYCAAKPGQWIWFSWHPLSMLLSFVALAGNATLIKKIGGYENTKLHGYFMGAATLIGLFGWYVIYANKEMFKKQHLKTLHGKVGVGLMLSYVGISVVGAVALHPDFGVLKTNKTVRFAHKWGGRVLTAVSWWCCVTGFMTMFPELWKQVVFGLPLLVFGPFVLL